MAVFKSVPDPAPVQPIVQPPTPEHPIVPPTEAGTPDQPIVEPPVEPPVEPEHPIVAPPSPEKVIADAIKAKAKAERDAIKAHTQELYDAVKVQHSGTPGHEEARKAIFAYFEEMEDKYGVGSDIANNVQRAANASLRP